MIAIWKDEDSGMYIAYDTKADAAGYGNTEEEAKRSLDIARDEILRYAKGLS